MKISTRIVFFAAVVLTVLAAGEAMGVTVLGTNTGAIADGTGSNGCGAPRDINFAVAGASSPARVTSISFTGTHTYIGDLQVILIAPNASQFVIFSYVGRQNLTGDFGDDSNVNGAYVFQDSATQNIWTAAAGVTGGNVPAGTYRTQAAGPFANDSPGPAFTSLLGAFSSIPTANGNWTLRFLDCAGTDTGTITAASMILVGPTAANSSVSGRLMSASGQAIVNARVTVTGPGLAEPRIVTTNPFGYFTVTDLPSGQTYFLTASSKRFTFANPTRAVSVNDDLTEIDFTAEQ